MNGSYVKRLQEGSLTSDGVQAVLLNLDTNVTNVSASIEKVEAQIGDVIDNPVTYLKSIIAVAGSQGLDTLKSHVIAAPLAKSLMVKHFGNNKSEEAARHLLKDVNNKNIVNGEGAFDRGVDTESKILEDIAHQLGYSKFTVDETVKGNVYLITERTPCPSCQSVIEQFKQMFPNVNVVVEIKYQ